VLAVLWRNGDKGDAWKSQSIFTHVEHAKKHTEDFMYDVENMREHIENALCRLAMALTIMNGEQDDQA
jgi:hypothetical protein